MCRLASKIRAQSPSNAHQYHYSPTRHHVNNLSPDDRKAEDKKVEKHSEQSKAVKKNADINSMNPSLQDRSPDRKDHMSPKVDSSEKKIQNNAQDGDKKKGGLYTNNIRVFVADAKLGFSSTLG